MQKKIIGKFKRLKPVHWVIIFLGIVLYFGAVLGIIQYQRSQDNQPLLLEVYTPRDGDTYNASEVLVQGKSNKDAIISVGGLSTIADREGEFSFTAPLAKGDNSLKVVAELSDERVEKVVNVNWTAPAPVVEAPKKKAVKPSKPKSSVDESELNNSGPESFWLFEVGTLSAAGAAWQMSRSRLKRSLSKRTKEV